MQTVHPDPARNARRARLALCLAALAVGKSAVTGPFDPSRLEPAVAALMAMGVRFDVLPDGFAVHGVGWGGLLEPAAALEVGTDGELAALLLGMTAAQPVALVCQGPAVAGAGISSVLAVLARLGARHQVAGAGGLLVQRGADLPLPGHHRMPAAAARAASALLLAALATPGLTTLEGVPPEALDLDLFGRFQAAVAAGPGSIRITGRAQLSPAAVRIGA